MSEEPLRDLFVLRQVKIPWGDLKKGDIFRTGMASEKDTAADPNAWNLAKCDGYEVEGKARFGVEKVDVHLIAVQKPAKEQESTDGIIISTDMIAKMGDI